MRVSVGTIPHHRFPHGSNGYRYCLEMVLIVSRFEPVEGLSSLGSIGVGGVSLSREQLLGGKKTGWAQKICCGIGMLFSWGWRWRNWKGGRN